MVQCDIAPMNVALNTYFCFDVQLNNTMRTITGSVRCTRTGWLPVLSNIAPADIRRELATSKMILRARGKPELPLLTDIDFHPRPRLKSRRPIWSNLPDEGLTIQDLWHTRWQNQNVALNTYFCFPYLGRDATTPTDEASSRGVRASSWRPRLDWFKRQLQRIVRSSAARGQHSGVESGADSST